MQQQAAWHAWRSTPSGWQRSAQHARQQTRCFAYANYYQHTDIAGAVITGWLFTWRWQHDRTAVGHCAAIEVSALVCVGSGVA
jgi:hypothetical protein